MQCREAVFAEDVLVYVLDNYRGEEYIRQVYNPDCYIRLDDRQAIIYQQVQNVNGEAIQKYGFSAIPNVFGLMSEEALEASGVLRIRRQPSLDLYGQGVLIGIVDTGIDYTHEAFVAADGTSRIVSIWDQSVEEGVGNENFPYGRMYSREQLNQALSSENPFEIVPSQDEIGHGTFMAGRGFTPVGYIKPEVVAPGVELTGTYPGNRYGTMTGTSVAAAFVAGISALFMQEYADDGANSNTVREALIRGAVPRGEPYPNTEWGYGIVDAYRSITDY